MSVNEKSIKELNKPVQLDNISCPCSGFSLAQYVAVL